MKSICIAVVCALVLSVGASAQLKLSQSVDPNTILAGNSVACGGADNGTFRFYNITGEGEAAPMIFISAIRYAVEANPSGPFPAQIRIYDTATGSTTSAGLNLLHTQTFTAPTVAGIYTQAISPPLAVPNNPALDIAIELFSPAGTTFFAGSNTGGQTAPTYLRAAACGVPDPTDVTLVGPFTMEVILDICYSLTPPMLTYPGTGEDLDTFFALNLGAFTQVTVLDESTGLNSNDCLEVLNLSLGGTFDGQGIYVAVGSLVTTGTIIPEVGTGTNIFVDLTGGAFIFDGNTNILGNPVQLPANGSSVKFTYPGGLVGSSMVVQAYAITAIAANGNYAATNGLTVVFGL